MATGITGARALQHVVGLLNELLHMELDAIEAYETAIDRLQDAGTRAQLQRFLEDHRQHTHELRELVQRLGGDPGAEPEGRRLLAQGKLVLSRLSGDKALLQAMRSNANETNTRYEKARDAPGLDARTRAALSRNLSDERRHRAWIVQRLETLSDQLAAHH
jgi:rubrerythrin